MVRYIALLPGHDQRGLFLQKVNKQADGASSFSPRSRFVSDSFEMHIDISSIVILPFKEKKKEVFCRTAHSTERTVSSSIIRGAMYRVK